MFPRPLHARFTIGDESRKYATEIDSTKGKNQSTVPGFRQIKSVKCNYADDDMAKC